MTKSAQRILVTGATGYIGGRLVPMLLEEGYRVRCLVRDPRKLASRSWIDHEAVEVVAGDIGGDELASKLEDCDAAYYLVHSMMTSGAQYAVKDLRLAQWFGYAAKDAGCERILYLGGLGENQVLSTSMGLFLHEHGLPGIAPLTLGVLNDLGRFFPCLRFLSVQASRMELHVFAM